MAKQAQTLVLAAFPDLAAAQEALERVKNWDEADDGVKAGAIGIIAKDADGKINETLLGGRAGGKGAKIGVVLGLIAAIPTGGLSLLGGLIAGGVGGGVVGHFVHRNYSLTSEDVARIHDGLDAGQAFIGVMVPDGQAGAFEMQLKRFGGDTELHVVSDHGEEKAAEAAAAPAPAPVAPVAPDPVAEKVKLAAQAFIYGYPLVYNLNEMEKFPSGGSLLHAPVPINTMGYARELLTPDAKFVSPNNDTLYMIAVCDLRGGPLHLHTPDTHDRYYVLQFVDAWTNNFAYIGRRATGTAEADYLIVPPGYAGPIPAGHTVVHSPTGMCAIVGRLTVNGVDDLPVVHALQDQFTLSPIGEAAAPAGIPVPDPRVPDELKWWEEFRVALAAFPPPAADAPFLALCESFGLTAADSPFVNAAPDLAKLLAAAEQAARAKIEELTKSVTRTPAGWQNAMHLFDYNLDFYEIGTLDDPAWKISDRKIAYVMRAVVARAGLWGNHGYEAAYQIIFVDGDGEQLDSDHRYELRLPVPPPVNAFWSLTMYNLPEYYLVANAINRYSIGDRTPGLQYGEDGSVTIYMQKDSPGSDKESNWLPTPQTGPFRPIMRMYQPGPAILDGSFELPAIQRLD